MSRAVAPPLSRYVALFRGINVGRAKRIAMADLRQLLGDLGYSGVRTLLNSGNAVYDGPSAPTLGQAQRIQAAVAETLGVEALVIVKSARDIASAVAANPLRGIATDPSRLLLAFTRDAKSLAAIDALVQADWGEERVARGADAAYLWCANGILESKAAVALLKGLAESGTTRNWATVEKIHTLLQSKEVTAP